MENKRKPKGSIGGTLQIKDLDAETIEKLKDLQDHFRVGTSSKAVLLAVRDFVVMKEDIKKLRFQLGDANRTIAVQNTVIDQIGKIIRSHASRNEEDILFDTIFDVGG
jgi:hypothetical protein